MTKKESPNSFKNFFSEVQSYYDSYGYAIDAKDIWEAREKIEEYLDFEDCGIDFNQRLKRELRENMKTGWVRFQGYLDDDGEFYNCWVITSEWKGGQPRWFKVWYSDYNRHYVTYGHRFEPKADEEGHRVNYSYNSCDVCNQINELKNTIKAANSTGAHACYCPRSVDSGCECAINEAIDA